MTRRSFVEMAALAGASALFAGVTPARASEDAYDVAVIGAGVVGCCIARELTRHDLRVVVLEAGLDIACGASRANSGIVHAGFDPEPGTLKARYNVEGAALFPQWQADLGFAYYPNEALVVAFSDAEMGTLRELLARGEANGVEGLRIIDADELHALEPLVAPEAIGALLAPSSAICDPYGLAYGAAENAAANGAEFVFDHRVTAIERCAEGGFSLVAGEQALQARAVVNAAGLFSDEMNNLVSEVKLTIQPKRGEYHLYNNELHVTSRTVFQTPTELGKGVLVTPVVFGNLICGPNSVPQGSKTDVSTTADGLADILEKARRTWPEATTEGVICTFAGLRASNANGSDFVIGPAPDVPGFFNAACIDSPGLASAPAIGADLAARVAAYLGAGANPQFNPVRQAPPLLAMMPDEAVAGLIAADPAYGRVVCRCSSVTEGELVGALHRVLPVYSLDALKWRTGATMGPCQGGRCSAAILEIAARELGIGSCDLRKRDQGSNMLVEGSNESSPTMADEQVPSTIELPNSCDVLVIGEGEPALEAAARLEGQQVVVASQAALADAFARMITPQGEGRGFNVAFWTTEGARHVSALSIVLAPGVYDKPRAAYEIPGTRPAGVVSARCALELLDVPDCLPGTNALVWGATEGAQQAAQALEAAGVQVARLADGELVSIEGEGRVERAVVREGAEQRAIECDLLVIAHDDVPDTSLAARAGVALDEAGYILVDQDGATNVPGITAFGPAIRVRED